MKTSKTANCILVIIILSVISSCHKTSTSVVSMNDYPNKPGDQWIYFVQDSLAQINDTLTVTVLPAGMFQGQPSTLWQFAYSTGQTDTLQAQISGDSINYYTKSLYPALRLTLLFPFSAGSNWQDISKGNYSTSHTGNYEYLSHSFSNVYEISHAVTEYPDYNLTEDIYITPGRGIVHRRIQEFDMGPTIRQTWTLISYHINQ